MVCYGSMYHAGIGGGPFRPKVYAYYYRQWSGFDMPYHRHDSTEIMYAIDGSCRIEIAAEAGGGGKVVVAMKKGDCIVLDAGVSHRLIVDGKATCRMLNVEFGFEPGGGVLPPLPELLADGGSGAMAPIEYIVLRDPDELYHALRSLVLELDRTDGGSGVLAELLIGQLLVRIARLRAVASRAQSEDQQPTASRYIDMCKAYIHENYDRELTAADIARSVNLHPGYLQRIFKRQTGSTIAAYLTELRMDKARMLLARTDVPAVEVADYVGINSRQYFHELFKRHTGNTPGEYRRRANKQQGASPPATSSDY